jgi:hypothetical protein
MDEPKKTGRIIIRLPMDQKKAIEKKVGRGKVSAAVRDAIQNSDLTCPDPEKSS